MSSASYTTTSSSCTQSASTTTGAGRATLELSGVFPPIATPFDNNENIDYDNLNLNLQRWNDVPFRGR